MRWGGTVASNVHKLFDEFLEAKHLEISGKVDEADWHGGLLRTGRGEVRPILANAIHALRRAPEWDGVLWYDDFATTTVARNRPPWVAPLEDWSPTPWSDRCDFLTTEWLQRQGIMVPAAIAGQAVETVARDRTFHPVREYLDGLVWDGTPRLDRWLVNYLGATDTPYITAVGPRWMISAVARVRIPGCQADSALILEGPQGIRKSSALAILAGPWFTDGLSEIGSKDSALETRGVWIIELAELDSLSRAEVSTVKAYITRRNDRFRPPYGKRLVDLPRQCVFAGSVNPEGGYLKDATGARRFWPVECGAIDIDGLKRDRDQLWAEAYFRFRQGEPWWLGVKDQAMATQEQSDRYQGDAWESQIRLWLDNELGLDRGPSHRRNKPIDDVSVSEVLQGALGLPLDRWTQADQNRVVRCLINMGFKKYRARISGQIREHRYRRPDSGSSGLDAFVK
jgi:predicted P-loop ATPase